MRLAIHHVAASAVLAASGIAPAVAVEDHSAVKAYQGSVLTRRDDDGFKSYNLVVGLDEKGKTDDEMLKPLKVEGELTRLAYENPAGRSAHEIFTNYLEALQKAGFKILFSCAEKECGPGYASSRWARVTGMRYFAPDMRYLAAKSSSGDRETYVAVLVAKLRHQVEIVEVKAMERGLVSAQAIGDGLSREGRAVLDGIYFDTDKATLTPDSKAALEVIGRFLNDRPTLKVFIVGHTDGTGAFEHNMTLSRERARAVVAALTQDHGIAADRMEPHGVGPLAPRQPNRDDAGRAQNRRVEMVER